MFEIIVINTLRFTVSSKFSMLQFLASSFIMLYCSTLSTFFFFSRD